MSMNKWRQLYSNTLIRSYAMGTISFLVGVKLCDYVFYDPLHNQREVEMMEE